MNKKTKIIGIALAIIVVIVIAFLLIKNKNSGELFKLTDKYNSLEITLKYPKDAGITVDEFDENYSTTYPESSFRNVEKNYVVSLSYREDSEASYNSDIEYAKKETNFSEVEFNKYIGYKYEDSFGAIQMILKLKEKETSYVILVLDLEKTDFNNEETNLDEIFNSKEFQKILKTLTFSDQVENKVEVDGVSSKNHKLTIKTIKAPNSDYTVNQYQDTMGGVMNEYILNSDKSKYNSSGAYFRIEYYGDEGNYKDLATYQKYREQTFESEYKDSDLFGTPVKKEISKNELASKYTRWDAGIFEKDGKVYGFLYYIYSDVDNSIGEELVKNVLKNIEINK